MEKFINNTKRVIFHKQKDILSSAIILSSMFMLARLFGFLRLRTFNSYFSKEEIGIFLAAFRLPDFIFEILITGALSAAFIPLFVKYKHQEEKFAENISTIINCVLLALLILIFIVTFFIDALSPIIMPGFSSEDIQTISTMSHVLLFAQLPFMVLGNILSGVSQANRIFFITALAPVVYNLGIIFGTIIFAHTLGLYAPVAGVIIGSIFFFLVQTPIVFITRFRYKLLVFNKLIINEFVGLFLPRFLTVITRQIDLTVDLMLSSLLGTGPYAIFYFAQSLQFFPVTFVGVAFGQASLPYLSDLFAEKKIAEFRKIFVDSILQLFFLSIPLALFFIFARTPIVRLALGGPKFDWEGTVQTAKTMSYFALSIPLHTIFYFITRSFYAIHNTRTPFKINAFSTVINTLLSVYFILYLHLPVWTLAFSFSIAITINITLLLLLFHKHIGGFDINKLIKNTLKICIAAFISSLAAYCIMKLLALLVLDTTRTIHIFFLLLTTFTSFGMFYIFFSWLMNNEEIYLLGTLLVKIKEIKKMITEVHTDVGS